MLTTSTKSLGISSCPLCYSLSVRCEPLHQKSKDHKEREQSGTTKYIKVRYIENAVSMISACSCACTFAKPVAGEALGCRLITP